MQSAEPDQENCSDVQIWTENENTNNNNVGPVDMSLIDVWISTDQGCVTNTNNGPSTSNKDNTAWHEHWKPTAVKRQLSDQKLEERREKNRRSAKESRERVKQNQLMVIENNKFLTMKNSKLHDDVEKLRNKVHNLKIVESSIIHQESCLEEHNIVHVNNIMLGCIMPQQTTEKNKSNSNFSEKKTTREQPIVRQEMGIHDSIFESSMPQQILEKGKYNSDVDIFNEKKTNPDDSVAENGYNHQLIVQQEMGIQSELSTANCYAFQSSGFNALSCSFQLFSDPYSMTVLENQDSDEIYSNNLNTSSETLSLIPNSSVSDQSALVVGNVSDQSSVLHLKKISDQSSPLSANSFSDQSSLLSANSFSDQSSLFSANSFSDQSSLLSANSFSDQSSLISANSFSDQSSVLHLNKNSYQSSVLNLNKISDQSSLISENSFSDQSSLLSANSFSDQSSLISANSFSDQSSLITANSFPDQSSPISANNFPDLTSLLSGNNFSDLSSLPHANNASDLSSLLNGNVSDQSSLSHVGMVSRPSSLIPEQNNSRQGSVNSSEVHNTNLFSSQGNISYLSTQPGSKHYSSVDYAWGIETDQNDDKEKQELINFFKDTE